MVLTESAGNMTILHEHKVFGSFFLDTDLSLSDAYRADVRCWMFDLSAVQYFGRRVFDVHIFSLFNSQL